MVTGGVVAGGAGVGTTVVADAGTTVGAVVVPSGIDPTITGTTPEVVGRR
ncbi:hypothetical protein GCM10009789_40030 [Kribbella sancticallisti]|uniref:Serine O-acetyltransferase n=1 Tax=Kribbella sancticallisti TaxID=460087 RepID=A0ABP4PQ99_9ACTN